MYTIKNELDYNNLYNELLKLAKNESIEDKIRHKKIINTNQEIISLSMKTIRETAKKISKAGANEFLKIAKKKLLQNSYYEETLIEGLVIAEIKDLKKQIDEFLVWCHKIDNWATCDSVVTSLKLLNKSTIKADYFSTFVELSKSENEFVSRFGIVTLMTCYLEDDFIDEIYNLMGQIKSKKYYVQMAIAWLISTGFVKHKEKTIKLLKLKILDKFVQNKAISKCRDSFRVLESDKEMLKTLRI